MRMPDRDNRPSAVAVHRVLDRVDKRAAYRQFVADLKSAAKSICGQVNLMNEVASIKTT
jgi:hypothetical protein